MRQYSADQVEIAWLGIDFKTGLAQGTFVTQARNVPRWTQKPAGAVSTVVRVLNPDESGTVSIIVDQESRLHQQLLALAESERNPSTRDKVATMSLKDTSSDFSIDFLNAYIQTDPDETRGVESATFTWVFGYERAKKNTVENPANVVGA